MAAAAVFAFLAASCGGSGPAGSGAPGTSATASPTASEVAPQSAGVALSSASAATPESDVPESADCSPAPAATPAWLPADLPLPPGTVVVREAATSAGVQAVTLLVPGRASDFADFVRERWPAAGFVLGRGDAEEHEAEGAFGRPPLVGQFKVNDLACAHAHATLTLRIAPTGVAGPTS